MCAESVVVIGEPGVHRVPPSIPDSIGHGWYLKSTISRESWLITNRSRLIDSMAPLCLRLPELRPRIEDRQSHLESRMPNPIYLL
jgi:hypothetical protein